jgi:hypothetical protein
LIDEAIPLLRERVEDVDLGMVDRRVALAIKARILLYRASPFYNGNMEYFGDFLDHDGQPFFSMTQDKEKWKKALDAIEEAIEVCETNGIELYKYEYNVPYLFEADYFEKNRDVMETYYNLRMVACAPWNREIIWGFSNTPFGAGSGTALAHGYNIRLPGGLPAELGTAHQSGFSDQNIAASYKMLERYYTKNGLPIDEDLTYTSSAQYYDIVYTPGSDEVEYAPLHGIMQPDVQTIQLYLNREPRFYANLGITGGYWRAHMWAIPVDFYAGDNGGGYRAALPNNYLSTCIGVQKLVHPENRSNNWQRYIPNPYPIIRLADLYLMKAEALNEYYGPGQEVYAAINKVRERAGIPSLETVWGDPLLAKTVDKHKDQLGMREIILRERGVELAFEGIRFWDMIRWKKAPSEFSAAIYGWNHLATSAVDFFQLSLKQGRKFSITDCLWPIDLAELNINNNLIQNPGW